MDAGWAHDTNSPATAARVWTVRRSSARSSINGQSMTVFVRGCCVMFLFLRTFLVKLLHKYHQAVSEEFQRVKFCPSFVLPSREK